jgi:hypothetical protein
VNDHGRSLAQPLESVDAGLVATMDDQVLGEVIDVLDPILRRHHHDVDPPVELFHRPFQRYRLQEGRSVLGVHGPAWNQNQSCCKSGGPSQSCRDSAMRVALRALHDTPPFTCVRTNSRDSRQVGCRPAVEIGRPDPAHGGAAGVAASLSCQDLT